ncbi:MAG: hypothetical protein V1721_01165 [Pseudomonadota bacterium]
MEKKIIDKGTLGEALKRVGEASLPAMNTADRRELSEIPMVNAIGNVVSAAKAADAMGFGGSDRVTVPGLSIPEKKVKPEIDSLKDVKKPFHNAPKPPGKPPTSFYA